MILSNVDKRVFPSSKKDPDPFRHLRRGVGYFRLCRRLPDARFR